MKSEKPAIQDREMEAKRILQAVWGPHYRFVGEDFVGKIQQAAARGEPAEQIVAAGRGGDSFEWIESVKILYQASQLISTMLTIYLSAQKILSKTELEEKVKAADIDKNMTNPVVKTKVDAVIDEMTT